MTLNAARGLRPCAAFGVRGIGMRPIFNSISLALLLAAACCGRHFLRAFHLFWRALVDRYLLSFR